MNNDIKKIIEAFDFNQVKNDKNKKLSQSIVGVIEDPHYAQVGDYLYRDEDGKYTLREIDVPWGICVIEAKNTPIEFDKAPQNMGGRFSSYCKANVKLLQK